MIELKTCHYPGCTKDAVEWYLHIGRGIMFLCLDHMEALQAIAKGKGVQFPHGKIGTAPSVKEIKASWKKQ